MRGDRFLLLIFLLGGLTATEALSVDMTLPAMPAIAAGLGTDDATVQLSLSALLLGLALGQLVHGPLADRYGRRPVLLANLALYVAATAATVAVGDGGWLVALRLVQGFAASVGQILTRAVVRDLYDRDAAARLLSYILVVFAAAPIVAPIAGAYVTLWLGWQAVFAFLAVYGAAVAALIWRLLGETLAAPDPGALRPAQMVANYREIAGNRAFWGYLACSAAGLSGLFAFLTGSPAVMITGLGLAPDVYGFYFAIAMSGNMIALMVGGRLVGRFGLDRLLLVGVAGVAGAGLLLAGLAWAGVASAAAIVGPMLLYLSSFALIMPQATAGALSPFPHIAGAASSLLGFLQLACASLAGALVGWLHDGTRMPMVGVILAAGAVALIAYLVMVRPRAARAE